MEEKKEEKVRISVRNLVEFILREGDLDSRQGGTADKEAMLLGGKDSSENSKTDGRRISCGGAASDCRAV